MKKLLSVLMTVLMLASLCTAALAEDVTLDAYGMSLTIPDGMELTDATTDPDSAILLVISSDTLQYTVTLAYDETMAGKTLADLSEEEGARIAETLSAGIENLSVGFETDEESGITYLVAANEEGTVFIVGEMTDGLLIMVSAARSDGEALSEEDLIQADEILFSIAFDSAEEGAEGEEEAEEETDEAA